MTVEHEQDNLYQDERVCDECGGLIYHDDCYLPEYAGFDYCLCDEMRKKIIAYEREILSRPRLNLEKMKYW